MKRFASVFLIGIIITFFFVGCEKPNSEMNTTKITMTKTQESTAAIDSSETKNETTTDKETTEYDIGGGEITQRKYRQCYYHITYQLSLLVNKDDLREWEKEIYSQNPDETNEMIVKLFVQHFNISREDFDKANFELAKVLYDPNSPSPSMNPKDYINQEMFELYNADIIYTFDDEIINEYYLSGEYPFVYESDYEQAVASGEYTPRTEEWVDIEKMEAEIIAKYGEAEIVTETTTSITEEITVAEPTGIETAA